MPLDMTALSFTPAAPVLISLSPKVWREKLIAAAALRRTKAAAEKTVRETDKLANVDASGSNQRRIQSIDEVRRHEENPTLR